MKVASVLAVALVAVACGGPPAADTPAPAPDPALSGTVQGRVLVEGDIPAPTVIRLDGDPKCLAMADGEPRRTEDVVASADGGLQHVFVWVSGGLPRTIYPVPSTPVVLDQQKCRYVPRVLGIQVGQPLTIRNSDPLLHNVRAEGTVNETFDVGTPVQGVEITRTFATREVMVPFKCNVHAWMRAYVGVVEHPYFAVTDERGRFSLPPLPPGQYTIETWHERFGTTTRQVTVTARETADLTFTYTSKAS